MGLIVSGATNVGRKRKGNEDSFYVDRKKNFFMVADGMGGHNAGEVASAMAVKIVPMMFYSGLEKGVPAPRALTTAINIACKHIYEKGLSAPEYSGMGTTCVGLYFSGSSVLLSNVGDSRCYLQHNREIYQLSVDHSYIQFQIDSGTLTRAEAGLRPDKNTILRCLGGIGDNVDVDIFNYKVMLNDIFLLCSDGLSDMVSDEDINFLINKYIPDPSVVTQEIVDQLVESLIAQANANGGKDNISVIVVVAKK